MTSNEAERTRVGLQRHVGGLLLMLGGRVVITAYGLCDMVLLVADGDLWRMTLTSIVHSLELVLPGGRLINKRMSVQSGDMMRSGILW